MQKELRRRLDTITILGTGICFFGIWGFVKTIMHAIITRSDFREVISGDESFASTLIAFLIVGVILIVVLAPHIYVGLSARGEGRRGKTHTVYLFMTGIMAALYITSIIISIKDLPTAEETEDVITSIILDFTVTVSLIQIIINSIKIRQLRKQLSEQEVQ